MEENSQSKPGQDSHSLHGLFGVLLRIDGVPAMKMAESQNLPRKNPVFVIDKTGNEIWMSYDAGLDYDKDGYTHEQEWKLWPPDSLPNNQITNPSPNEH